MRHAVERRFAVISSVGHFASSCCECALRLINDWVADVLTSKSCFRLLTYAGSAVICAEQRSMNEAGRRGCRPKLAGVVASAKEARLACVPSYVFSLRSECEADFPLVDGRIIASEIR